MEKVYEHQEVEKRWYDFWEKKGYFQPRESKKHFSIILPPPNANGRLHIGHAMYVIEDIMVRYHRLLGDSTLWLPGADHAGILTQVVYERELEKSGKTRQDLGREEFFKQTYAFSQENKKQMYEQLRAMGFSLDWSREKFTLDPEITKVVYQTFKALYDDGLIYRGTRMINWCPRCATVLSDLEVVHQEKESNLWFIRYPIKNSKEFVTVATTRPETMLGDTAVAVHPQDKRYKDLVGKTAILPLMNREILIIADSYVNSEFGTGAVKITPAHDPNDYEIGQKHNLSQIQVVGLDDKMTDLSGSYTGLDKYAARKQVVADLEKLSLIEKTDRLKNNVGVCERCATVVEPQVSLQWFVAVNKTGKSGKNLAKDALAAVKSKKIKIIPARFEKIYYNWMENIHDWCISRQLWWGHQIPVWYCGEPNQKRMGFAESIVSQVLESKTKTYRLRDHSFQVGDKVVFENSGTKRVFGHGRINEVTRTTVGELPLADKAHGAVYQNVDELIAAFKKHNPDKEVTSETAAFIYGYEFIPAEKLAKICGELIVSSEKPKQCPVCGNEKLTQDPDTLDTWFSSGQWPFTTLGYGQKDDSDFKNFYPTSVMETGYDILFFWVARMIMLGLYVTEDVPFQTVYLHGLVRDERGQKMSKSKNNAIDPLTVAEQYGADAVRMALVFGTGPGNDANLGEAKIKGMRNFTNKLWNIARYIIDMAPEKTAERVEETEDDKWILAELDKTKTSVTKALDDYRFSQAAEELYDFVWRRLADRYIESTKSRRSEAQAVLEKVLEDSLRLLHPFMPFITEEIWQRLPNKKGTSIMVSEWPV
ncbi:MAG: class I tRNA ligase family protein [bacterium]|nr:class I tRNA ligase family protein [bacterium]